MNGHSATTAIIVATAIVTVMAAVALAVIYLAFDVPAHRNVFGRE